MRRSWENLLSSAFFIAASAVFTIPTALAQSKGDSGPPNVSILPYPDPQFKGVIGRTTLDSKSDFPQPVKAPKGAPNVLLIMTDDVGFAASSTFGGPIPTPTLEALAANGLKFNEFSTTALCSPTRAALITGRDQHTVHTGIIMERSLGYPGYDFVDAKERRHDWGDSSWQRLQHGLVREEPQCAELAE